jgi:hypothetical protein
MQSSNSPTTPTTTQPDTLASPPMYGYNGPVVRLNAIDRASSMRDSPEIPNSYRGEPLTPEITARNFKSPGKSGQNTAAWHLLKCHRERSRQRMIDRIDRELTYLDNETLITTHATTSTSTSTSTSTGTTTSTNTSTNTTTTERDELLMRWREHLPRTRREYKLTRKLKESLKPKVLVNPREYMPRRAKASGVSKKVRKPAFPENGTWQDQEFWHGLYGEEEEGDKPSRRRPNILESDDENSDSEGNLDPSSGDDENEALEMSAIERHKRKNRYLIGRMLQYLEQGERTFTDEQKRLIDKLIATVW